MRLGQLARKLSLRPAQIIEFLAQQNIQIEESSNTRMEESHVELVVQKFAPESLEKIVQEPDEVEVVVMEETILPETNNTIEEVLPEVHPTENKSIEEVEIIRVPKIELSGLKVLGKIELPGPQKKETPQEQVETTSDVEQPVAKSVTNSPRKPREKKVRLKREQTEQRKWNNPLEQQRELEAREAEERRLKEIEREKEKRKKHYHQKVKSTTQPKRVKQAKDESAIKVKPTNTTQPKTWLGKFWKWVRSD